MLVFSVTSLIFFKNVWTKKFLGTYVVLKAKYIFIAYVVLNNKDVTLYRIIIDGY